MADITLRSSGNYHVAITAVVNGRAQWKELAVTRWSEDAVLDDCGTFLFVREAVGPAAVPVAVPLVPLAVDSPIGTEMSIAVAGDCDVELRRLQLTNRSSHPCTLTLTSYSEILLSPAATDAAILPSASCSSRPRSMKRLARSWPRGDRVPRGSPVLGSSMRRRSTGPSRRFHTRPIGCVSSDADGAFRRPGPCATRRRFRARRGQSLTRLLRFACR